MILYKPPTIWGILRGAAINLLLPFVNGLMLGFGELFAHEAAFRLGWSNTKVRYTYFRHVMIFLVQRLTHRLPDLPDVPTVTSRWPWGGNARASL